MIGYARRALGAHLRRGRSLFLLTVLGVALGIASMLAIQLINRSALAAFAGGLKAVSGDADLSVVPRLPVMPESTLATVLADRDVAAAWPLEQITVAVEGRDRFYLEVVGVDVYAPVQLPWAGPAADPGAALTVPGWAAGSPDLAAELGLAVGDSLVVSSGTRRVVLRIGALVDFRRIAPLASRRLVVMDIAQAQALLGTRGVLHQVDLRLVPGAPAAAVAARLSARLGPTIDVLAPEQRTARTAGLLAAFRLNLTALSLISLVVGFFLVYSSTQAALVRRRTEFGVLRATGATRGQVFALILSEVALLGAAGVIVGIPLGWWAARANLAAVSASLSNLYLLREIEQLDVPWWLLAGAAGMGLLGAGVGALGPALDMSRRDVRALLASLTLHQRTSALAAPLLVAALALLGAAGGWYALAGRGVRAAGFVLAVALLLAMPLAAPWLVARLTRALPVRGFGPGYALRALRARLQTTAFAVASLAIAVAMMVGITVMVGSFRRTVQLWVASTLRADVYVTAPSWRGAGVEGTLDAATVAALAGGPGVRAADRLRGFPAWTGDRRIALSGVDMALPGGEARFPLLSGDPAATMRAARAGGVIITEPLSRKTGLTAGDSLPLTTMDGERRLRIAGVSYDYSVEYGAAAIDLGVMTRLFGPGPLNSMALYLEPGRDPEQAVDDIRARLPGVPLNLRSNRSLRAEVFRIFDQTFAVTRLLQVMALLVAVTGVTLTLLILARERVAELALYRSLGASRRQLFLLYVGQGLGLGTMGLAGGLVAGAGLAGILIFVINRAYFGWTIQVSWPWATLAQGAALVLAAAAAASLYPALRASATPARELSRDDL